MSKDFLQNICDTAQFTVDSSKPVPSAATFNYACKM